MPSNLTMSRISGDHLLPATAVADPSTEQGERSHVVLDAIGVATRLLRSDTWENHVPTVLVRLGQALAVQRIYVLERTSLTDGSTVMSVHYGWAANSDGSKATPALLELPWGATIPHSWNTRLARGEIVVGRTKETGAAAEDLTADGIAALMVVPVTVQGVWWGIILVGAGEAAHVWSSEAYSGMDVIGAIAGTTIEQSRRLRALHASDSMFKALFEHSPDALMLIDPHQPGWPIVDCNAAACAMHGYRREDLVGLPLETIDTAEWNPVDVPQALQDHREQVVISGTAHHRRRDGTMFPVDYRATLINLDDHELILGIDRDISDRVAAEQALRDSDERFRQLVNHIDEVFWLAYPEPNQPLYVSPAFATIWGFDPATLLNHGEAWIQTIHPDDQDHVRDAIPSQVRGTYDVEYRIIRPDGSIRWIHDRCFPIYDAKGNVSRLAGVARDITERRQFEEQLRQQALYDSLTGLPNRTLLRERLGRALTRMRRHANYHFAVLFLDLDRFKTLNDSLGHTAGDQVLIGVAHRLETCVRPGDTVARLGGDEFVLFLDDIVEHDDVLAITERVQHQLSIPFVVQEQEFLTSASIGIAWSVPSYTHPDEILRDADAAMYRAKAQGRAGYAVFDPGMRAATLAALRLERELRHAIDDGSFELHFQPIVAVQGGRIIGAEALVRWQHPRYGRIPPDQFIPVAEESGLIVPLGKWVLRTACQTAASWRAAGLAFEYIAVNIAARQLRAPDLHEMIDEVLHETGLPPQALKLELTESGLMEHTMAAQTALEQIKARGIGLAIDDFGTGYSSLAYLHRFPVDTVKIDRAFISTLGSGNDAIATAAIAMAHGLHLHVVAEGVETEAQVDFLQAHRCDAMQGYLISKPLPPDAFYHLLATHSPPTPDDAEHLVQAS